MHMGELAGCEPRNTPRERCTTTSVNRTVCLKSSYGYIYTVTVLPNTLLPRGALAP